MNSVIPRLLLALLLFMPVAVIIYMFSPSNRHDMGREPFQAEVDLRGALPVFPGAEGFGTDTPAGRGGRVIRVTTLDATGPGSLQEAIQMPGPRTIVFEVGGIIETHHLLVVTEPFVTIAGQTAPPPGITIAGAGIDVVTHDVLIQHLRLRVGDHPNGPDPDSRDGIGVHQGGQRVVIDRCSIAWAIDEGTSTWGRNLHDITFSNCIIAENLSRSLHSKVEHSKGLLIGDNTRRISVLNNLFAHNMRRNPLIKGNVSALVANNYIHNPGRDAIRWSDPERSGPSISTVLNNVMAPGPDSGRFVRMISRDMRLSRGTRIHEANNRVRLNGGYFLPTRGIFVSGLLVDVPMVTLAPLTLIPPEEVMERVLDTAGAWASARDEVDLRVVESVRNAAGAIIDSPSEVGGLPMVMPVRRELDIPANPNEDSNGNGYTNLEEWLHEFAAVAEGRGPR